MEAVSLHQRAKILQLGGDLSAAEADARKAVALAAQRPSLPPIEARARAVLSSILLAAGRAHEAISDASRASPVSWRRCAGWTVARR